MCISSSWRWLACLPDLHLPGTCVSVVEHLLSARADGAAAAAAAQRRRARAPAVCARSHCARRVRNFDAGMPASLPSPLAHSRTHFPLRMHSMYVRPGLRRGPHHKRPGTEISSRDRREISHSETITTSPKVNCPVWSWAFRSGNFEVQHKHQVCAPNSQFLRAKRMN